MRVTVLGCGWSSGVPVVGCDCPVCRSDNPRNKRRRASILIEADNGARLLVDASPDLRAQLLDASVTAIDAVLFTHAHADHIHGLDDLRPLNYHMKKRIPAYSNAATVEALRARFGYAFRPPIANKPWIAPSLELHVIEAGQAFTAAGVEVLAFDQEHGAMPSLGFRLERFAYSTDVKSMPEAAFAALEGIDTWIVDCAGLVPHPTHSHLEQTLAWISRVAPRRAVLTHMAHRVDYDDLAARLPPGVAPAYDGLVVEL